MICMIMYFYICHLQKLKHQNDIKRFDWQALLGSLEELNHLLSVVDECSTKLLPSLDRASTLHITTDKSQLNQRADALRAVLHKRLNALTSESGKLERLRNGCNDIEVFLKKAAGTLKQMEEKDLTDDAV